MKKINILLAILVIVLSLPIPVSAAGNKSRLVDEGDLLSTSEEQALQALLDDISERQKCDVVIVAAKTLGGQDSESYADDYYDYNGYGFGDSHDGIMLVVCMEERDYAITSTGFGKRAFTDYGVQYIQDQFLPSLSKEEFYAAFTEFANLCDDFLTQARNGKPYDIGNKVGAEPLKPTAGLFGGTGALSLALGYLISWGSGSAKKRGLKSVHKKTQASAYMTNFQLTTKQDLYVRSHTTSSTMRKSTQSGGTTTHMGSSGTSHGGAHGKF